MPSQTPLIMVDNVFDRINLYPTAVLSSSGEVVGREVRHVADYRRERTYWQAATNAVSRYVRVDLGAGSTRAVDFVWIDRGHNLWGLDVGVETSDDNFVATIDQRFAIVPASGTVGGDPLAGWCVTEEGALYRLFAATSARRYLQVRVATAAQPILTGVIVGARNQLTMYASSLDEDAGRRSQSTEESRVPGYMGRDRTYSARRLALRVNLIGATEYDATIRYLRRVLFERDQPAAIVMNHGVKPERCWLYQYEGGDWSSATERTYRRADMTMVECGPLIR